MLSRTMLYYGRNTPLSDPVPLRAGPLHLLYDQGDLRSIHLGEAEILRRVYVAVRDRGWGTIAPVFIHENVQADANRFLIRYDVENRAGPLYFAWQAEIRGEADGTITFRMQGEALSTFWKNRIGFCVLHPAALSGQAAMVEHCDGSKEETRFAVDICADQPVMPFSHLRAIRHRAAAGVWAEVEMRGDSFEMEDQRLWTDASFKTYCTPLRLPYPVEMQAGTKVAQSVTLRLIEDASVERRQAAPIGKGVRRSTEPVQLAMTAGWKPAPPLGLAAASHGGAKSGAANSGGGEAARLRALNLHHLRVEISLAGADYADRLRLGAAQAAALGIPMELALGVSADAAEAQLMAFRRALDAVHPRVCGWLVFPDREPYAGGDPCSAIASAAAQILKPVGAAIPLAAGTNTDFIFLKRTTLPLAWLDQVCITLNPQVHAFDNQSLVETLQAQPVVIESARRLARGLPVVVSPITLKPRFNAYASGPQPVPTAGELPAAVDVRQISLFGAGWTLGTLRAMTAGGAARITCYETTGWRGVMETEAGSPPGFPSIPGSVFPLYHVMADYGEYAGGQAAELASSDGLCVSGLALRKGEQVRYLLANHSAKVQPVHIAVTGEYTIRRLDETNAQAAMQSPESFRMAPGETIRASASGLRLEMLPFAVLTVDAV